MRNGESNRQIGRVLGLDKKTVNRYAAKITELAVPTGLSYEQLLERLDSLFRSNTKPKPAVDIFKPFAEEIRLLIIGDPPGHNRGMKPKTAWEVISRKYELQGKTSYESFKRFVRLDPILTVPLKAVPRLETEPGQEVQIDYGKVGIKDVNGRSRTIYAYCGLLSASRLPYIEFVLSQDAVSFSQTTASMFTFYGGVPTHIVLDNLKAGILAAHIYDPTVNRTFAELCDYYQVIPDPARPAAPKDKGKIELLVPVARELFRRLNALYPSTSLVELNKHAVLWCKAEYGNKKHGTTGIPPQELFNTLEQPCLTPLPEHPFIPARWVTARVHPDQFIQIKGHWYGLPASYIGKQVDVRIEPSLVTIYYEHHIVRQYTVSSHHRHFLKEDFSAYTQPFVPGSYAQSLVTKASRYGSQAQRLITQMLASGGNLAIRRAQGCLTVIEQHQHEEGFSHVLARALAEQTILPTQLQALFMGEAAQHILPFPVTETGKAMARRADYYTGP